MRHSLLFLFLSAVTAQAAATRFPTVIENSTILTNRNPAASEVVYLEGVVSANDGDAGMFKWTAGATNAYSVDVLGSAVATGRWLRITEPGGVVATDTNYAKLDTNNVFVLTNTFSEIIVSNGITLGGVRQTTWPAGGTNASVVYVDGGAVNNPNFDDGGDINFTASSTNITGTVKANSVALGGDTTGDYVTNVVGTAGRITASGAGEGVTVTLDLATSGVTSGSYTNPTITVDTYGRITAATNGSASTGGGLTFVSGTAVTNINLNNTTPAAPATGANVLWQLSDTNASAYLVTSNFPTLNGTNTFTSTNTFGTVVATTLEVTTPLALSVLTNDVLSEAEAAAAYQPLDSDLTAVAGLSTTGLINRTGAGSASTIALPGDTTNFLRADGTFAVPPGGGTNVFSYDIDVTAATTNATAIPVFTNVVTAGYVDYAIVDILAAGVTNSASFRLFAWARNDAGTLTFKTNAPDAWQIADSDLDTLASAGSTGSGPFLRQTNSSITLNSQTITNLVGTGLTNNAGTLQVVAQKTIAHFTPLDNQPPTNNYATLSTRNSLAILQFDHTTEESATFVGIVPNDAILTSGLIIDITWMTTATSGAGRWGTQIMRLDTDLDSDSYGTAIEATTATTSATAGIPTITSITNTNLDSIAVNEPFRLKIYRDTGDAADTINSDDLQLIAVGVRTAN